MRLPAPQPVAEAATRVLIYADQDGALGWVQALEDGGALDAGALFEDRAWLDPRITAVYYAPPPQALGLAPGRLLAAGSQPRTCALERPLRVLVADIDLDAVAASEWVEVDPSLPDEVRAFLLGTGPCAPVDRCRPYDVRGVDLVEADGILSVVPLDSESALVSGRFERFWRVTRDSAERRPDLDGLPGLAASVGPTGTIWLGGARGRVAHGDLRRGFTVETVAGADQDVAVVIENDGVVLALALPMEGSSFETSTVTLHLRQAGSWRQLTQIPVRTAKRDQGHGVWLDDGGALLTYGGPTLLWYDGDRVRERGITGVGPENPRANAVVQHPEHGVALAAADGRLYLGRHPFDDWTHPPGAAIPDSAQGLTTFEDGFILGGPDGIVTQYYPDHPPCDSAKFFWPDAEVMVPLDGDVLVAGGNPQMEESNRVLWLGL